ncbi:hypothetical protein FKW77_008329 [Venturia effusa]|uniref:RING-type domain-containing protein n=1 Tax=Venturia effusa TaxID=50376 RepID=A0A517LHQ6_9PEZI|nr:hypothetical protein FKW77_008329 [Venturia effusa]
MGTLTAHVPQLAEHCSHKLASSCRLTSTPNCCACADDRPHNPTYRKYIDGLGYVQLGVRWDHYCWPCYCKLMFIPSSVPLLTTHVAFWNVRVQQSGIPHPQTRIPHVPNQDEFTRRWLEFHQGYRIIKQPDGREERIAVSGEPLKDVDPGVMPRTLDELRAGHLTGAEVAPVSDNPPALAEVDSGPSLDEALDQLLGEALTEEAQEQSQSNHEIEVVTSSMAQPNGQRGASITIPSMTATELATLRHNIEQVRRQIEVEERNMETCQAEMASDAEDLAQTQQRIEEYQQEASSLRRRMARFERYILNEREHAEIVGEGMSVREAAISQIDEDLQLLRRELRQYRHRAAGEGNFARVFGTREDIQSEDYVSPITNMFTRVNEWGRRQQAQTTIPQEAIIPLTHIDDSLGQEEPEETYRGIPDGRETTRRQAMIRRQTLARRTDRPQLEVSPIEVHRDTLGTAQGLQIDISAAPASPSGPTQAVDVFSTPTMNWAGVDRGLSPSTNMAGPDPYAGVENWLPADTSPETDLHDWLSVRGYVPNTRVRRAPDRFRASFTAPSPADSPDLQLPDLRARPLDPATFSQARDIGDDDDDSPRLSARRERMRREARQQFQERHQDLRSILSGGRDETGNSRNEILEATIAAYTTERRHRFPTLMRAMRLPSSAPQPPQGLDIADERPEAKTDEQLMLKVECKICLSQVADTACLPCGHLCMCSWCADQAVPVKKEDRTRPARKGLKCPVCREIVKSRGKIFI